MALGPIARPGLYAAEPDPQLAGLVTRFYEPTDEEVQRIAGMSRAALEKRAMRTEQFLEQLAALDRAALGTADRIDYDYLHAQLDNCLQQLRDIKIWQKRPADYVPFNNFFAATLDEALPWEDRYPRMFDALTARRSSSTTSSSMCPVT